MTCGIYKIENIVTNEVYIGQSIAIETRWSQHKTSPSKNVQALINAYEYDSNLVTFEIVKEIDSSMYRREELNFILDIWEDHILDINGGLYGKNVINAKKISIHPVPLTILKYNLPEFLDKNVLYEAIKKYSEPKKQKIVEDTSKIKDLQKSVINNQHEIDLLTQKYNTIITEYKMQIRELERKLEKSKKYDPSLWALIEEVEYLKNELSKYQKHDIYSDVHDNYLKGLSIA